MDIEERIDAFSSLGDQLTSLDDVQRAALAETVARENPWFTPENIDRALEGIAKMLTPKALRQWTARYQWAADAPPRTIALVLAGNIPLVGFHDVLCVLISGNIAMIKPSSKDTALIKFVLQELVAIAPAFGTRIIYVPQIKNFDAVIATGSDNASRYFDYYFAQYPHIIRKNRTSCAVITGRESAEELTTLGVDVFSYFGLGCRNVSKLYVPTGYDFTPLLDQWNTYDNVINHHKYANNYDYQKAIMLVNKVPFLDTGFVMLTENDRLVSPIAVLYYEVYHSPEELSEKLAAVAEKIQCITGHQPPASTPLGQTQLPTNREYADHVDTLAFLQSVQSVAV